MSITANRQQQEAHRILSFLARGLDPFSGAELLQESCLNRPEIIRALLFATDALSPLDADCLPHLNAITSDPISRAGDPWCVEEDEQLRDLIARRQNLNEVAAAHNRTRGAIISRMVHLELARDRTEARTFFNAGKISRMSDNSISAHDVRQ